MPKLSLEIGLAVFGLVLTIVLLVLDKAEKLKGPVLYWLLALAAVMTLPLVLGNPFVAEASASWKYWLRTLVVSIVALTYWAIGIWISPTSVKSDSSQPHEAVEGPNVPKKPEAPPSSAENQSQPNNKDAHGTTDKVEVNPQRHGTQDKTTAIVTPSSPPPTADQIAEALARKFGPQQVNQPCRLENGQLVNCRDVEILEWGKPLLARLDKAIQQYIAARTAAHQRFERDHDQAALDNKLLENIDLNRYLEEDYKNLVVYRAAAISKLKGGNPENYDPVSGLSRGFRRFLTTDGRLVLSDADSLIGDAQSVLRDLQELSSRLAQQVEQESKTN